MFVHILEVSTKDSALREHLGAVWAEVWLVTGMFPQVNLHVATLRKCTATPIYQALEEPLMPVSFRVKDSDGLTHLFRDGLEAFLLLRLVFFFITVLNLDIIEANPVFKSDLGRRFVIQVTSWGQNRCASIGFLLIRKIS